MSNSFKDKALFVDDPMVHSQLLFSDGEALIESEEYEKALSRFERYRMYHPEDPNVYYQSSCCHYSLGNYDYGLELVERSLTISNEFGLAYGLKGLLLIKKQKYMEALSNLQYCNVLLPNDKDVLLGMVMAFMKVGYLESAMTIIKQLVKQYPTENEYKYYEAKIYRMLHQYEKAISLMECLVKEQSGDMEYLEYLNYLRSVNSEILVCRYPGMNN